MRVAQLTQPRSFALLERDPPRPGPGQALLRILGCGVCGSNLPPWRGLNGMEYPLDPGAPGHEAWGEVVEAGADVGLAPGTRVAGLTYRSFAEYDVVEADRVVALPPELGQQPVPGEPVACAVNVTDRAQVRDGDVVVVLGIGFLGGILVSLLREELPKKVLAVSRRPTALEAAVAMGADEALGYDEVEARVAELSDGEGAHVVVECTGASGPLDLAARLCRVRGRMVVAGYHQDGPRTVDMQLWNWKGLDVVNAHERDPAQYVRGMEEGVRRIAEGRLDLAPLLTHELPLEDIGRAFELAESRERGFMKASVVPGDAT